MNQKCLFCKTEVPFQTDTRIDSTPLCDAHKKIAPSLVFFNFPGMPHPAGQVGGYARCFLPSGAEIPVTQALWDGCAAVATTVQGKIRNLRGGTTNEQIDALAALL